MSTPPKATLIGTTIGRFKITRTIGHGGMGTVYEALQEAIGYRAAVKVLGAAIAQDPRQKQYVERFLDEARAVNLINHPGVVRIFDYGETADRTVYIMMEFLEGKTLAHRILDGTKDPSKRATFRQAMRLIHNVASAMAQAHERGILHRDLKPENLVVISDPDMPGGERVKILDFGLARFLDSPERRTTAGIALGTPLYMSPEQCFGSALDGKSDVYSLGAIFYEVLTGAPPFMDTDQAKLMLQHVNRAPKQLREVVPGIPEDMAALAHAMLSKEPGNRPEMREVTERLDRLEREGKLPPEEGSDPRPNQQPEAFAPTVAAGSLKVPAAEAAAARKSLWKSLWKGRPARFWMMWLAILSLLLGLGIGVVSFVLRKPELPPAPQCPPPPPIEIPACPPPPPVVEPPPVESPPAGENEKGKGKGKGKEPKHTPTKGKRGR